MPGCILRFGEQNFLVSFRGDVLAYIVVATNIHHGSCAVQGLGS